MGFVAKQADGGPTVRMKMPQSGDVVIGFGVCMTVSSCRRGRESSE